MARLDRLDVSQAAYTVQHLTLSDKSSGDEVLEVCELCPNLRCFDFEIDTETESNAEGHTQTSPMSRA